MTVRRSNKRGVRRPPLRANGGILDALKSALHSAKHCAATDAAGVQIFLKTWIIPQLERVIADMQRPPEKKAKP